VAVAGKRVVKIEILGDAKGARQAFGEVERAGGSMSTNLASVGAGLTAGITAPILAIGGSALSTAANFESALNEMGAVSEATDGQMAQISETAINLGNDMSLPATSATDAALAMVELSKAGLSVEDSMAAAKGALQLAAAGQLDEAEAAQITAQALNAFGLSGDQAVRVADLLAAGANASAASVDDLGMGLQQAGFAFQASGQPVEHLVTSLAALTNVGLTGSDAGTALKNAMIRLMSPTDQAAGMMEQLGISVFDANGQMLPLPDIIGTLNSAMAGMTDEQRNAALETIFMSDGMKAMLPLLDLGKEGFLDLESQVSRQGAAADLASAKTKGLKGALDGLKSQLETLLLKGGMPFLGFLEDGVRYVAELIPRIAELNPTILAGAGAFLAVLAAAGPVLLAIAGIGAAVAFLLSPVGLLVLAIGLLAAAFATNFMGIRDAVMPVLGALSDAVNRIVSAFQSGGLQGALDEAKRIFSEWASIIGPMVPVVLEQLKGLVAEVGGWIINTGVPMLASQLAAWADQFGAWAVVAVPPMLAALAGLLEELGAWIADVAAPAIGDKLLAWGAALVDWVGPRIVPVLTALWELYYAIEKWLITEALAGIVSKLLEWGTAFVSWVGPQIPPLLAELGALLVEVGSWLINTGVPTLVSTLLAWGLSFVAWVNPQIQPLIAELGLLLAGVAGWMLTVALPAIVSNLAQWGLAFLTWIATDVLPFLVTKLAEILVAMTGWILTTALPEIVSKLAEWGLAFLEWIATDVLPQLPEKLAEILSTISGWVESAGEALLGYGAQIGQKIVDGFKGALEAGINAAIDIVNGAIGAINNALSFEIPGYDPPGPGPKFDGFSVDAPDISTVDRVALAKGGIVMPRLGGVPALLAEAGVPEAVIPLDSAMARSLFGGGGQQGPIVLHYTHISQIDSREVARESSKHIINDVPAPLVTGG
jgi:TP901 family phage tail tape measure protein